jgi:predicted nucleotidyltransferase component of viral defense system
VITRALLDERVREWGLRDDVVEKDYVLGWLLWGIGANKPLGDSWVFKGGTCLKKCYIETYRFSEDLDFTVLPDGPIAPEDVLPLIAEVLSDVNDASGIDFSVQEPRLKLRPGGRTAEGRIYYSGPRGAPQPARIKLDLSADEVLARPPVLRPIAHAYPDELPAPVEVRCYGFEELFAEKIRAMGERSRPRDLYDIVNLFRREDLRLEQKLIRSTLEDKCVSKGIAMPTHAEISSSPLRAELESEWENMLGHQLPVLPPFEQFWEEAEILFQWLEGNAIEEPVEPIGAMADEDRTWSPPPTLETWGRASLEVVRFAGVNHLLVELGYNGSARLIEPYSLRRSSAGNLLLYGVRADSREIRCYRVDRIESARATTQPFQPVFAIEFGSAGGLSAPPVRRRAGVPRLGPRRSARRSRSTGPTYIVRCATCGKEFRRKTRSTAMRKHKSPGGWDCPGRSGYFVRMD